MNRVVVIDDLSYADFEEENKKWCHEHGGRDITVRARGVEVRMEEVESDVTAAKFQTPFLIFFFEICVYPRCGGGRGGRCRTGTSPRSRKISTSGRFTCRFFDSKLVRQSTPK